MSKCNNFKKVIPNKTLLITIVFIVILLVLYLIYNNNFMNIILKNIKTTLNNNDKDNKDDKDDKDNKNNKNNISSINNKLKIIINDGNNILSSDNFENVVLSGMNTLTNNIEYDKLTEEQKKIIRNYRTFFNDNTQSTLNNFVSNNQSTLNAGLSTLISNYNNYSNKINTVIEEINYDLLRQLQRNYALAHKVNTQRQIELQDIDNLPQRFD